MVVTRNRFIILLLLLMTNFITTLCANHDSEKQWRELEFRIDTLLNSAINKEIIPGGVVCIVRENNILLKKAYGHRCVIPTECEMTTETIFDLASLSKCISTATAIMQLEEQGKLSLDDNVKKYVPDFKPWIKGRDTIDIKLKQLLSHSSGVQPGLTEKDVNRLFNQWGGANTDSLTEYIATKTYRKFRPGTKCLYSCLNFIVLQSIAEKISGEKLDVYARKNIFDILGMNNTRYIHTGSEFPVDVNIAATTVFGDSVALQGQVHDMTARILNDGVSGNAGVFSNADNIALFCMAIMNGGELNGKRILKKETVDLMTSIARDDEPNVGRALGWDVNSPYSNIMGKKIRKHKCVCHTGYTGTSIVMDLETKTAIILLTNRVHPKDKGSLKKTRNELADIVADYIF